VGDGAPGDAVLDLRSERFLEALNAAVFADDPELQVVDILRALARHACDLTGARYGAMGVLHEGRPALKDFIHVGLSDEEARRIGALPVGHGLLGAVIRENRTIRVASLKDDPRAAGVPAHHPAMTSFLGVPLRMGDKVFGNFYLADKQGGGEFTEEDARLLERFGAHAAMTVAFARQREQERRRLFEALVHHAPHGIMFFPAERGREPYGNPAAERMLGRVATGDDPSRGYELRHPDGRPFDVDELPSRKALAGESIINLEALVDQGEQQPRHVLVSAAPVRGEKGGLRGAVLVFQDVTALKELDRLREEFAAIVAHDLRNPVQALLLQVKQLMVRATGDASWVPVRVLRSMKQSGERLGRLIGDLVDASRVDARRIDVALAPVQLPELVAELVAQVCLTLGDHDVEIEVHGTPPPVLADRPRLEQILTNLLENSAKYGTRGTPIRVVIEPESGGATLAVVDSGPGIAPQELPKLFDRYYQTRRARELRSGLGLGLYIARGYVTAQGGTITAESTPGKGSTFRVWLRGA
jgi:signal transduction histidine kinase